MTASVFAQGLIDPLTGLAGKKETQLSPETSPNIIWGQGTPGAIAPFTTCNKGSLYLQTDSTDDYNCLWLKVDEGGDAADWVQVQVTPASSTVPLRAGRINFDNVTTETAAGNYGATLDCTWLAIDPGSGGSFGAKLMFSNTDTSGYVLYGLGLRCRSAAASAKVVALNVSGSAAVASSGQVMGGEFYLQNSGSYTIVGGSGYPSTALHVKSVLAAACDKASALWIDDESTTKPTTQYMVDITMNGSTEVDEVFHIYGGDPGADTFIDFDTCDQGTGAFVTATSLGGATRSHKIKCKVNGSTVGYMSLYTD